MSFVFAMRRQSFRLLCARNLPPAGRCKPLVLVVAVLVGACGGGRAASEQSQIVLGSGFRYAAPAGWKVRGAVATDGAVDRVEVKTFELVKRYRPELFAQAATELDRVVADLARQLRGRVVDARTVTIADRNARSYRIRYDGKLSDVAFVLQDKREYQLLCRREAGASDAACKRLLGSFALR